MPSLPMASCAGQAIFLSSTMTGPGRGLQPVDGLLDDLERLVHLVEADAQPAVGVAAVAGDDVEVVGLVAAVGLRACAGRAAGRSSAAPGR